MNMKLTLTLFALLLLMSCSTQSTHTQRPSNTDAKTSQALSHPLHDTPEAIAVSELEQQAQLQPNNPELLFNLGMAYLNEDESNKSTQNQKATVATFNQVLRLVPGNIATLKALYNIHYDQTIRGNKNAFSKAKVIFYQVPLTQRAQLNPPSLAKFVHLYIVNKSSPEQALTEIYQALLDASIEQPSNDKAYIQLAKLYRIHSYYPLALATLKLGAENIEDSPDLYRAIANTYEARANAAGCSYDKSTYLSEAVEYYKRAIPLAPEDVGLHYNLAQLYMDNNLYQLALHETAIVLELEPNAGNLVFAAQNYSIIGNQQKAAELLVRATNAGLAKSDSAIHEIYMNSGEWKKAAISFTEYLQTQKSINVYDFIKADIIGQQADIEFGALANTKKIQFHNEWEAAVFAFWTNKLTSIQLEKNATNRCERTEYFFYSGYRAFQSGNKVIANQKFSSALQQKTYRFIERPLARYFLNVN